MERNNIFNLVHKGLRAALYSTAITLQRTDFTRQEEADATLEKVEEIIFLFDGHAAKEDHFVLPAIATWEPSVVAAFESEHQHDEELALGLKACVGKVKEAETPLEKLAAGRELDVAFAAFTAFNLQHMAREEDILLKILWRYYTDEELKDISTRIVKSMEPWINDFYTTWMIRGINDTEVAEWYKEMQSALPEPALQHMLQKAKTELEPQRYHSLTKKLKEIPVTVQ